MPQYSTIGQLETIRSKQPWLVLNAAETFSVARSNNPAISHFYQFKAGNSPHKAIAIPDGCVDILFDCDTTQPNAMVFGSTMEATDSGIEQDHQYFGVRFASGVVPDCMEVSAEELVQHSFSLLDIVPHAEQLFETVVDSSDFATQVASFQQFFESQGMRQHSPLTQAVVQCILDRQGNVRVDELAGITGFTTRTIQRQFGADIGMSPKQFSRIIRCQSAVYSINHGSNVAFSDMAFQLGFSDQSHFLREFKKLVKATPMAYQSHVKQQTYIDRIQCY